MPDEDAALPSDPRTAAALSERVAVIEVQQKALKEDTGVIRSSIHGINNEMQKFVQAEQRCADNLAQILTAIKDLPTLVQATTAFNDMRGELHEVIDDRKQRQGLAAFGRRFAMIVGAGAALMVTLGGMAAGLAWFIQHLWKPLP